jgi:hypothetical protein
MGCDVYANGDEIACKAGDGKVIASFPDVCLSPPSPPAGPVPVPYPDTSFSKDMQSGSKTVMIKDQEVMLKDQSFYKTSPLGDEAATNGLGAGVITHVITGKTYFVAWSMDVKFEDQNVDRHSDMTTSNHASPNPNAPSPNLNLSSQQKADIAAGKCICDPSHPEHSAGGKPMTMEEWYTTDVNGNPLVPTPPATEHPNVTEYKKLMEDVKNKKDPSKGGNCTCKGKSGKLVADPPCHVFFKPVTDTEKTKIEDDWGKSSTPGTPSERTKYQKKLRIPSEKASRKTLGLPSSCKGCPKNPAKTNAKWPTGIPTCSCQKKIEQHRKVNHLVPKTAGGCPSGDGNLHPNGPATKTRRGLCDHCRGLDARFGDLQSKTPRK